MGQERLSGIVIVNIKREFRNNLLDNYVDTNIEIFGKNKSRNKYFSKKRVGVLWGARSIVLFKVNIAGKNMFCQTQIVTFPFHFSLIR